MGAIAIIITSNLNEANDADVEHSKNTDEATDATDRQKELAPDFEMVDRDGNRIKLSDMRGKPVVLNFWASWCGPCKSEMPDFEEAYKEKGDNSAVADFPCEFCGKNGISIQEDFYPIGYCCYCGEDPHDAVSHSLPENVSGNGLGNFCRIPK